MRRLKNYYCWYTIRDWLDAQAEGYVKLKQPDNGKSGCLVKKLLDMAGHDCMPLTIVCVRGKEGYYIESDDELYAFFNFLNDRESLTENGRKLFFSDFDLEKRANILNAQIHSIWIDMD